MATLTLRNAAGEPLNTERWLPGVRSVDADEAVTVDATVVERLPDAVVIELDGGAQPLALPASQWTVEGDDGETRAEVLARVGGDLGKARAELAAEQDPDTGRNRVTLIRALQRIVEGTAPVEPAAGQRPRGGDPYDYSPALATADNPTGRLDLAGAPGAAGESVALQAPTVDERAGSGQVTAGSEER